MDTRRIINGPLYTVPADFAARFLNEFPDYRIRWSYKRSAWQIEQKCGRGALPPLYIDPEDDSLIRARDGYWRVMEIQPGDRMACPAIVDTFTGDRCLATIKVPIRETAEAVCENCLQHHRDGRVMAAYWPLDETFLDYMRMTDPLRDGTRRQRQDIDNRRALADASADRAQSTHNEAVTIDAYDRLVGIPHNTTKSARYIHSDKGIT